MVPAVLVPEGREVPAEEEVPAVPAPVVLAAAVSAEVLVPADSAAAVSAEDFQAADSAAADSLAVAAAVGDSPHYQHLDKIHPQAANLPEDIFI